ncbi:MAG: CPBP family intramembrane glutamic endopeptidase [Terracidiphilus sp.]
MPTPEYDLIDLQMGEQPQQPSAPAAIAPAWHTIVLVAGIVALSIHSAVRFSAAHGPINRLATYGFTAAMEVGMLAWVVVGLRLGKTSLRSLLGSCSSNIRSVAADLGFAAVFWIASLMVLGTLGIAWSGVEFALTHRTAATRAAGQTGQVGQAGQAGQALSPDPARLEAVRALAQLAPANGREIAAWTLLCLLVGFVEEIVFRGYLQRQFIGWARGRVMAGVLFSAIVFGSAHAYQGARSMVLLTVFGVLFSLLALYRRSLRAGIFAHAWHDLIAGLALALLRSSHIF